MVEINFSEEGFCNGHAVPDDDSLARGEVVEGDGEALPGPVDHAEREWNRVLGVDAAVTNV